MFNIAIIGTGQLGSRHAQGVCGLTLPSALHLVDTQQASLDLARERIAQVPRGAGVREVSALQSLDALPSKLDVAIVATGARDRLQLLRTLLARSRVSNLVLEKFLFQREQDYDDAARLFAEQGVRVWVNCPRRSYELYRRVQEFFAADPIRYFEVDGGDWGLGCNSVHFADLFNHLTGAVVADFDTAALDRTTYPSKRAGYVEFAGRLTGRTAEAELRLAADHGRQANLLLLIRGAARSCLIDETARRASFYDAETARIEHAVVLPRQSELTGPLVQGILADGRCDLPEYATSAAIHLPLLRSLLRHYVAVSDPRAVACPIT